jgi:hypothetical protein
LRGLAVFYRARDRRARRRQGGSASAAGGGLSRLQFSRREGKWGAGTEGTKCHSHRRRGSGAQGIEGGSWRHARWLIADGSGGFLCLAQGRGRR